jgi:hypothetical protein
VFQVHQNIFQLALESLYRITTNLLICNCKKLAYYLTALSQSQHSFTFSQSAFYKELILYEINIDNMGSNILKKKKRISELCEIMIMS